MSYGGTASMEAGESAEIAALVLEKLGIGKDEVEKIKKVPYASLIAAGSAALEKLSKEKGRLLTWAPTIDNKFYMDEMTDYAKKLPYMCGSVFSEFVGTQHKGIRKNEWTAEEIDKKLTEAYGDDKDAVAAEFSVLFPEKKIQDVLFYDNRIHSDMLGMTVFGSVKQANDFSHANVYHYLFSFEIPVNGGITAFHGGELHFAFHNIDLPEIRLATGAAKECYQVQDDFARALVNFAATGNPSQENLEWTPWSEENRETMIFDANSRCVNFNDTVLCNLLAAHNQFFAIQKPLVHFT